MAHNVNESLHYKAAGRFALAYTRQLTYQHAGLFHDKGRGSSFDVVDGNIVQYHPDSTREAEPESIIVHIYRCDDAVSA